MDYLLPEEESEIIHREIRDHHIDLRLGTELKEILPDENGRARAVITSEGEEISGQFVGLTVGVHPNVEVVRASSIETNRGVLVNEYFETNVEDVYAIGDCAEFRRDGIGARRIEQLWYTGRNHGKTVAFTICGHRRAYHRGVFFNSAKFFTVEYQTYGDVPPTPAEGTETLCWHDVKARKLLRIDYEAGGGAVRGVNVFGLRHRHEVWEAWIREGWPLARVLQHLDAANFDPEFFRHYEPFLIDAYNRRHPGTPIPKREKPGLFARLFNGRPTARPEEILDPAS